MAIEELLVNPFPELSELMEELPEELPEAPEQKERFQVKDKEQAEWCLRQISRLLCEQKEIEATAQAEIEKITTWKNDQTESIQKSISFFEYLLTEYHQQVLKKNPKAKLSNCHPAKKPARPAGVLRTKKQCFPGLNRTGPNTLLSKRH